jgi:hypothetical protein
MLANITNESQRFMVLSDFAITEGKPFMPKAEGTALAMLNINDEWIEIDTSQAWFWTDEWQAGERKVEEYIKSGNIQTFDTIEDFMQSLRK